MKNKEENEKAFLDKELASLLETTLNLENELFSILGKS